MKSVSYSAPGRPACPCLYPGSAGPSRLDCFLSAGDQRQVGVRARDVDGFVIAALDELGIDVHRHHSQTFEDVDPTSFELIITLSPEAHHRALEFTRGTAAEVEYWPMPDPGAVEGTRETQLEAYRQARDQILARLKARFGSPSGPSL